MQSTPWPRGARPAARVARGSAAPIPASAPRGYVSLVEPIRAVQWAPGGDAVRIIDQRRLPSEHVERDLRSLEEVREAIVTLAVRGAPAIGVAAALGLVAALAPCTAEDPATFRARAEGYAGVLTAARPTAVNLGWAMRRMTARVAAMWHDPAPAILAALRDEASAILAEDRAMCEAIGAHGLAFVPDGARVLTHCNAGALATSGIGTALAPVYRAHAAGRRVRVFADETRPLLQGSRLTAWELQRAGVPVTVLTDGMAASLMRAGEIDVVLVGADRIAANGDVANKIGTYGVAVAARHHGIPMVVCAPWSTIDHATPDGAAIEIEQRDASEVRTIGGVATAPAGVAVRNPAFDVTPHALVSAVVTDRGVHRAPYSFTY
ncbi:MAG: S-methyl-5-thioribose-1-phosphate isomerase [Gemmatimonadetes bacterium]|nr:S-methyl-5-thioribose-1-phosphate isomerase [Gemmatimonadota bacterium]